MQLPTNKKFNNRYDNKCHLCNKITDEDLSHIIGACIGTSVCFDYIRYNFLIDKSLVLSLDLMQIKTNVDKNDYFYISYFVYAIWITRFIVRKQKTFAK